MAGFYVYVSGSKVEMLAQAGGRRNPLRALAVTLKSPVAEASVDVTLDKTLYARLAKVRRKLDSDPDVVPLDELADKATLLLSYSGNASLSIVDDNFMVALAGAEAGLLLIGSKHNVTGAPGVPTATSTFSGISMAPLDAIVKGEGLNENRALSNQWQQLWRRAGQGSAVRRRVRGLALYSGSYLATKAEMRRAGHAELKRIVLGSPVYVEQF